MKRSVGSAESWRCGQQISCLQPKSFTGLRPYVSTLLCHVLSKQLTRGHVQTGRAESYRPQVSECGSTDSSRLLEKTKVGIGAYFHRSKNDDDELQVKVLVCECMCFHMRVDTRSGSLTPCWHINSRTCTALFGRHSHPGTLGFTAVAAERVASAVVQSNSHRGLHYRRQW